MHQYAKEQSAAEGTSGKAIDLSAVFCADYV